MLEAGYTPDTFVDGPLITALREGALLYIEELNRVPEETLNVLVGALAEGEIHVPRLGRVAAAPSFRLIAAMNPFDAVGTARVSQAIADRMCRIAIGYQDAPRRARDRRARDRRDRARCVAPAVELTRAHPRAPAGADGRLGARRDRPRAAATGLARCAARASPTAGGTPRSPTPPSPRCPAGCGSRRAASARPEAIVLELIDGLWPADRTRPGRRTPTPAPGKADGPPPGAGGRPLAERRRRRATSSASAAAGRSPRPARRRHGALEQVSPAVGRLDEAAFHDLLRADPDAAVALLADLGAATDPQLRAQARRLAARLFVRARPARRRPGPRLPAARARRGGEGDLDLDLTLEARGRAAAPRRRAGRPPLDRAAPRAVPARRPQRLDARPRRRAGRDGRRPRSC